MALCPPQRLAEGLYEVFMTETERRSGNDRRFDEIQKAQHYNSHPSGVECIDVVRHTNFNIGQVFKYLWRAGLKGSEPVEKDLKKAAYYLDDEIRRVGGESKQMQQERVLRLMYHDANPVAKTFEIWYEAWVRKLNHEEVLDEIISKHTPITYTTPSQEEAEKALQERLGNVD